MSDKITFYDLANKRDQAWNPNTWKTRTVLNFKKIPYTTEWVEYPDLAPKLKALGVPPNKPGAFADYTCPTIRLPDGSFVMESPPIAEKLEALYPEPSLHLETGLQDEAYTLADSLVRTAGPDFLVCLVTDILREPAGTWFAEDRKKRFGATLEQVQEAAGGEKGRPAVEALLEKIKTLLTTHKKDEGPFVLGSVPSYADFIIAALFESLVRMHEENAQSILNYDSSFKKLHAACKPWLGRDD